MAKRTRKTYRVVVKYGDRATEELVDALDWKDAVRRVRRNNQGAVSIRAFLVLGATK